MAQNFDIDGFDLSAEDMDAIAALDLGHGVVVDFEDAQARMKLQEVLKKYKV